MDAEMGGFITCLVIGLVVVIMGAYMAVTKNPALLHGYHYADVPPARLPRLARLCGIGLIVCGVGCMLLMPAPAVDDALGPFASSVLSIVGAVLLVAGIGFMTAAIARFNGSLFSFGPAGAAANGSARPLVIGLGALLAVVVGLSVIVPGAQMIATGDPSSLHGYHLVNVAEADMPALAHGEGIGMVVMGVGLAVAILAAMLGSLRRPSPLWSKIAMGLGLAGFGVGMVTMLAVIVFYNGSLMG